MTDTTSILLPQHQALLDASGISPGVAEARGYRSVTTKAELRALGFSASQARVPALLIPVHDVHGELATYQARPDEPRIRDGKPLKYETPRGSHMVLDVPPAVRDRLGDPSLPLFITEGARKADAAASRDLCCVALLGVWNWRGTNAQGGKTALPDFEAIALNGRTVYLAFDSDVVTKPAVRQALDRFAALLRSRKADVQTILLPPGPGGSKTGLDDYLAAGHTVSDLLACVVETVPSTESGPVRRSTGPYRVSEHCIEWLKGFGDIENWVRLTNFAAEIREEIIADDGLSERGELIIAGRLWNGQWLPDARVPVSRFEALQWVTGTWGTAAIIAAGQGTRDRVREAIQRLSPAVVRRREFTHPGWREIGESWCFLTQAAVIGPDGTISGMVVRLAGPAAGLRLPPPPGRTDLVRVIESTLHLLDLAPDRIMVPLLGAVFRAVLNTVVQADLAIFLVGPSGVLKSELAAVIQRFFGPGFDRLNLPASWAATPNYLERVAFDFKDCLLVIDDFAPAGTPIDVRRYHQTADRVIRGAGNASGRGRMQADGAVRPSYPPRALILGTGEDIPSGYSIRARMIVLELVRGDVDADLLGRYQDGPEREHPAAMLSGLVRWIAGNLPRIRTEFPTAVQHLRTALRTTGTHARTPDALAQLGASWQLWIRFAREAGALSPDAAPGLWHRIWAALEFLAQSQSGHLVQENPVQRFLDLLTGCVTSGVAHIAGPDGNEPATPEAWGWRERVFGTGDFTRQEWHPQGNCIGWLDADGLYLEPAATYRAVQQFGGASGTTLAVSATTLWKRLDEAGLLQTTEKEHRETRTVRRTFASARRRTLHLAPDVLTPPASTGQHRGAVPADRELPHAEPPEELWVTPQPTAGEEQPPSTGQAGQVGQVKQQAGIPQCPVCVFCGTRLSGEKTKVCPTCGEVFHGAAA